VEEDPGMDKLNIERAAVFGAGGPTGFFISTELLECGVKVRALGRHRDRLDQSFAGLGVETMAADALELDQVERAVAGCDLVVDCIGLPADRMADHPRTARNLAEVVRQHDARCLQVSSFWAYLPIRELPVTEDHPRQGGVNYVRYRREAEDILQAAGAAVVHLPDFYGPRVHTSTLQQPLQEAMSGKAMSWIGRSDTPREYAFVPDAMRMVAALASKPEAFGESWIIPGAGPLTGNKAARIVGEHLGREVKLRAAGPWMLRLVSLFLKPLKEFMPMVPYYVEPIAYDGSKLERLLGPQRTTPYEEGIRATLEWLKARR
jgi:nucleoside-diphosphate-sugar epimerase